MGVKLPKKRAACKITLVLTWVVIEGPTQRGSDGEFDFEEDDNDLTTEIHSDVGSGKFDLNGAEKRWSEVSGVWKLLPQVP